MRCQVMRLALQQRKKAIAFVSSVGILAGINHPEPVRESEEALDLATEHLGDGGYAMGCGAVLYFTPCHWLTHRPSCRLSGLEVGSM